MPSLLERNLKMNGYRHCEKCVSYPNCENVQVLSDSKHEFQYDVRRAIEN